MIRMLKTTLVHVFDWLGRLLAFTLLVPWPLFCLVKLLNPIFSLETGLHIYFFVVLPAVIASFSLCGFIRWKQVVRAVVGKPLPNL